MKLNLGCGDLIFSEFVNCDLYNPKADVRCDVRFLPFKTDSIDEIYALHVIEHFDFKESFGVLLEWKRVLKPNGFLKIETPNLLTTCKAFVEANEQDRVNFYGHLFAVPWISGQIHKFLYTETQLRWTLGRIGFREITTIPALRYIGLEHINLGMVAIK